MIELINLSKSFENKRNKVNALKEVSIKIDSGEIFGIIGYSGAGKSTLVRCINLLERPTEGIVKIDNVNLIDLKEKELREYRKKIGMIFQQFNLLSSRNVFDNVAFPLKFQGKNSKEIKKKVHELLELVGISDKANAYPSQLSGGQKQRVAIARALANDPGILLCDEATSALDPQTTKSILKLLKSLNKKLGITIVIITHEMNVIKEICSKVAVMENGFLAEFGDVSSIFAKPKSQITKDFINTTSSIYKLDELINEGSSLVKLREGEKLCKFEFSGRSTKEAVISTASQKFDLKISIIFGNVEVIADTVLGSLIVIISGNEKQQEEVVTYLREKDIKVEVIKSA